MILPQPMTYRQQMRIAVVAALENTNLMVGSSEVNIQSPGDWSFTEDTVPAISVRTGRENKSSSVQAGLPQYNTSLEVEVRAVVSATTAEAAQQYVEDLWYQVENCILTDFTIVGSNQNIPSVMTSFDASSDGENHLASIHGVFTTECFEVFDPLQVAPAPTQFPVTPSATVNLDETNIDMDLKNIADPTGNYSDPQFPQSVVPAPRTEGPDGRAEGSLLIPLQ